jgi:hypothetical protein
MKMKAAFLSFALLCGLMAHAQLPHSMIKMVITKKIKALELIWNQSGSTTFIDSLCREPNITCIMGIDILYGKASMVQWFSKNRIPDTKLSLEIMNIQLMQGSSALVTLKWKENKRNIKFPPRPVSMWLEKVPAGWVITYFHRS